VFARVAIYEVPGHRAADAVDGFREAIEQIEEMEGLREAYMLISPESGRALTMTIWGSRDAMERSRVRASRLRSEAAKSVEGGVFSVEEYQIAVHETVDGTTQ